MDRKLCIFCGHFVMSPAVAGFFDEEDSSDFSIECYRFHWEFDTYKDGTEHFKEIIKTAKLCKDYNESPGS